MTPRLSPIAWAALALGALAAALVLGSLGTPTGHSHVYNMSWMAAVEAALAEGALYPRHLPALWDGFGGLDFFFYPPLPFHLAAGPVRWLCPGCSAHTAFALAGGVFWAGSGLAMVALARLFLPPLAAIAAGIVYMLLPYHLAVGWFVRQAAGEFAAYAFVPLIAAGMVRAMRGTMPVWLPLPVAGLLLCHLPTALLVAHVLAVIFVAWAFLHPRAALPAAGRLALTGALGLALAALFWLPAVVLLGDVSAAALAAPHLDPVNWLWLDGRDAPDTATDLLVAICLGGALAAGALAVALARRVDAAAETWVWLWIALPLAACAALMTAPARPIWEHWIIGQVQFPFRLMVMVDMVVALAAGVLVLAVPKTRPLWMRLAGLAGLGAAVLGLAAGLPKIAVTLPGGLAARGAEIRMIGAPEYLPPDVFAPVAAEVVARDLPIWRSVDLMEARLPELRARATLYPETAPRRWTLATPPAGPALLSVPYWRHMTAATGDGTAVAMAPDAETGLVRLDIPAGADLVVLRLPWHWSEQAGAALSLAGLAGVAGLWAMAWRRAGPRTGRQTLRNARQQEQSRRPETS